MKISPEKPAAEAQATGFRQDVLEKGAHLLGLLDAMRSHPFLKGKLALKGGTALNLFVFDAGVRMQSGCQQGGSKNGDRANSEGTFSVSARNPRGCTRTPGGGFRNGESG
jgi:hypothetical protein